MTTHFKNKNVEEVSETVKNNVYKYIYLNLDIL